MNNHGASLTVTQVALERIRAFRLMHGDDNAAIRISVYPEAPVEGKYELEFVASESVMSEDTTLRHDDILFVMDQGSARLLDGTCIDYREGMWSSGFHFNNPNRLAMMADPLAVRIQSVIEDRVLPMVSAHGGIVSLVDVRDQRVFIQFGGGCQGCGLAPQTLKHGVVQLLRDAVPEVVDVVDVTDHAAGENPYFPTR